MSARALMDANRRLIEQALQAFMHKQFIPGFDTHVLEMIRRMAHWMGPFPASRAHHHAGRGGLFTHSLGVAVAALHMSMGKAITFESSPRDRDADHLAWQLICFAGGMLHDVGKLHTVARVMALSVDLEREEGGFVSSASPVYGRPWQPMCEGFEMWVQQNHVRSYFLDFDFEEALTHRDYTERYVMALIPRPLLAYIYNSGPPLRQQWEDFIQNPESPARTPIFEVVQDADHVNVGQSLDPRRRPGSEELTGLILRRFAEYAQESRWNLPNSPFCYAHVQRRTPDGIRYFGLPFFIASEASIDGFLRSMLSKPMLGVSLRGHQHEIVFNCLESVGVLNRTIAGLLPEQKPLPDLKEYVPASHATVRFRARQVEGIIRPVEGPPEDALLELPVIPVRVRIPSTAQLSAPVLAFQGEPSSKAEAAPVIPVEIDRGEATPADPAMRHDPEYMAAIRREIEEFGVSEAEAEVLVGVPAANGAPHQGTEGPTRAPRPHSDEGAAPAPRTRTGQGQSTGSAQAAGKKSGASPQTPEPLFDTAREAAPASRKEDAGTRTGPDAGGADKGHVAEPAQAAAPDGPDWLRLCRAALETEEADPSIMWAILWLYLRDNPHQLCNATQHQGCPVIRGSAVPKALRDLIQRQLSAAGVPLQLLSKFWPSRKLDPTREAQFETCKVSQRPGGGYDIQLSQAGAEAVAHYEAADPDAFGSGDAQTGKGMV